MKGFAPTAVWGEKRLNINFFLLFHWPQNNSEKKQIPPAAEQDWWLEDSRLYSAAPAGPGEGTAALPTAGTASPAGGCPGFLPGWRCHRGGRASLGLRDRLLGSGAREKHQEAERKDRCQVKLPIGVQKVL